MFMRRPFILGSSLAVVLLGAGSLWLATRPLDAEPTLPAGRPVLRTSLAAQRFAGDAACAPCHPTQARAVSATHHAATVRKVDPNDRALMAAFRKEEFFLDPYLHTRLSPAVEGGRPGIRVRGAGTERFYPVRWVLGASQRGYTFLCEDPKGYLTEGKISYYPTTGEWSFTPGQPSEAPVPYPIGRRGVEQSCLPCHSVSVVAPDNRLAAADSRLGIGCESCHGPAAEHVRSKTRDPAGPMLLARFRDAPAAVQVNVCGGCHRPPSDNQAASLADFQLARFQGTALGKSACYQRSEGRLTCTTCHDPHTDVSRQPERYNRVCATCHSVEAAGRPSVAGCRVGKSTECISCHMQAQDVGMPDRQVFRSHWIR